ncbi:hypothetical protein BRC19_01635 [Candidatus Saccharibacteria bacterium QS_5_54_17]|nr:MAG: hypothetical protein BRC19_01635 [Candidatus Saccharibacteria bacterium QS_5_54_17]
MNTAARALELRNQGRYQEADRLFQDAYEETSGGIDAADLLFNWADAVRRLPGGEKRARAMLEEATDILWPIRFNNRKVYAACVHHKARFLRSIGDTVAALGESEDALRQIRRFTCRNPLLWFFPHIDNLTIRLDVSSIRAINGYSWKARTIGLSALVWAFHPWLWMKRQVGPKHVVRAGILLTYAGNPFRSESRVQGAFFGNTARRR